MHVRIIARLCLSLHVNTTCNFDVIIRRNSTRHPMQKTYAQHCRTCSCHALDISLYWVGFICALSLGNNFCCRSEHCNSSANLLFRPVWIFLNTLGKDFQEKIIDGIFESPACSFTFVNCENVGSIFFHQTLFENCLVSQVVRNRWMPSDQDTKFVTMDTVCIPMDTILVSMDIDSMTVNIINVTMDTVSSLWIRYLVCGDNAFLRCVRSPCVLVVLTWVCGPTLDSIRSLFSPLRQIASSLECK